MGEPAAAESSLRQGRGSRVSSFQNPIQNFLLLHTSSKNNNFLRSDHELNSNQTETSFSRNSNRNSKTYGISRPE